jgi:hypothetical protein
MSAASMNPMAMITAAGADVIALDLLRAAAVSGTGAASRTVAVSGTGAAGPTVAVSRAVAVGGAGRHPFPVVRAAEAGTRGSHASTL